jgi:hypothetical protein
VHTAAACLCGASLNLMCTSYTHTDPSHTLVQHTQPLSLSPSGPVTILNWSFPRKDISRAAQAAQLALALRQEVDALQTAGCRIIQVGWGGHGVAAMPIVHAVGRGVLLSALVAVLQTVSGSVTGPAR